ncbi:MAG: hypothetical protein U5K54_23535 [Cytophagales bacterium]|nr:hypothetical protein [Cytophagales bacterium]
MKILLYLILLSSLLACGNKKTDLKTESIDSTYVIQGNTLAKISFETISGELKRAMQNGGIEHALKILQRKCLSANGFAFKSKSGFN